MQNVFGQLKEKKKMIAYPFSCELNITNKCNLNCYFCSMGSGYTVNDFESITIKKLDKIVEQLKKVHCCYVSLSGGEPMVHPEFFEIAKKLTGEGFRVTVATNGTLITEKTISKLMESGISWIQISMHSFTGETCKKIMGYDVQKRIMNAVQLVKNINDVGLTVCIVRNQYNVEEIPQIIKYLKENNITYLLRDELKVGRIKNTINIELKVDELIDKFIKNRELPNAKIRKFSILTNGDIVSCSELGIALGNIYKDDLQKVWTTSPIFGLCKGCGNTPCLANYYYNNKFIKKKVDEINAGSGTISSAC